MNAIVTHHSGRTLLICLAIALCGVAGCKREIATGPAAQAVAEIKKLGGKVETDPARPGAPVTKVYLHSTPATDADLANLAPLTEIETLSLGRTQITDAGLAHLRGLTHLKMLSLNVTSISDAGLQQLKELPNLKTLNLLDTKVTDAGVRTLQKALPDLAIGYPRRR